MAPGSAPADPHPALRATFSQWEKEESASALVGGIDVRSIDAMSWRIAIEPFLRPLFFLYSRLTRGKTLGVRVLVQKAAGEVLLVRHTYLAGWWLPGGGVDAGETLEAAAVRELREETGLIARGRPVLLSVHSNERFFRGDHVALYRVADWDEGDRSSLQEIAEVRFFPLDALPEDLNRGSRDRILEATGGGETDPAW